MTRKEAIKLLVNATYSDEWQGNEQLTKANLMAIEALQAEQVKHGEWIENTLFGLGVEKYHGFKCSVCNEHTGDITNFCPNCGAKMDG